MAAKKARGLGMGLNALFSETDTAYDHAQAQPDLQDANASGESVLQLPLDFVQPNPNQPRKNFSEEPLKELSDSIKVHGVIQPIVVHKTGSKYTIIAGERRYRASLMAGLETIPAIVKKYTQREIKEISIIENLQREDLNPIEAARAIKQLMEEFNFTQEKVADRLGKSRPAIANTLRLLSLSPSVLDLVESGKLSPGHARTLVVIDDIVLQNDLAKEAVEKQLSVRDFEKAVKEALNPKPKVLPKPKQEQSLELKDMAERMQRIFATRVQIMGNDHKGRVFLDYFSRDDLDRINQMLDILSQSSLGSEKED